VDFEYFLSVLEDFLDDLEDLMNGLIGGLQVGGRKRRVCTRSWRVLLGEWVG